jgi:hypothetical protein
MEKIMYAELNIVYDIEKINQNFEEHTEFINFANQMKIYELYKWNSIKSNYIHIKKKVSFDKKIFRQIINICSNIINYLPTDEITSIEKSIKQIQSDNEIMIYKYSLLQTKHNDTINKCKYLLRNNQITKVYEFTHGIQPLIIKLYENYIDIKIINKKTKMLKNTKGNILGEIQKIKENLKKN